MNIILVLTLLSTAVALLTGVFVFIKNPKNPSNLFFSLLAVFIGLYSIFNYLSITASSPESAFVWVKVILLISAPQGVLLLFFASTIKKKQIVFSPVLQTVLLLWILLVYGLALNNLILKNVTISDGAISVEPGPLIPIFVLVHLGVIILGSKRLIQAYRSATGQEKHQLRYVTFGLLFSFVATFLVTLVLPLVFDSALLLSVSPLFLTSAIVFTAYAIIAHQFFDIKTAVIRSVVYILALGSVVLVYSGTIFVVTSVFGVSDTHENTQRLFYLGIAVLSSLLLSPLKIFFDRLTDKFFFRDRYNAEKLVSDYSDYLVDEIDTDKVINKTLALMDEVANPDNSTVILYRDGVAVWHDATGPVYLDNKEELAKSLEYQSAAYFTAESARIHDDPFAENIKKHMIKNGFEVSVRLSTHGQLEGFILLGGKKSGTKYTQKDLNFFVTIANELSVTIQNSERFDQIQRFNVTLQQEVEEATARLKQTNEKLKQLDTAKDEFISMASHQLRTPLTSVKGYLSMVIDGDAGDITDDQKKLLTEAFASSQRMVYLIADLLNVSRLKTGKFVIEPSEVDLRKMVQEEVEQLTPTATTRQILIKYSPPAEFPVMTLDETKTRQVIMNFIDNAIYYTKGGGEITVTLLAKKDSVEYRVIDNGIGIPAAEQHKLFTKFFRAENAKRARPDGTGLGLYMAQKIIAAQGGSITFKSTEGKGSTFGFNMPINVVTKTD